ncbi:MAG: AAA family ATPase [Thiobacillaceae bacterium]|jgi:hypothetical protein|nr:AAA family ATPase [Thiobacillaceae bacterium]
MSPLPTFIAALRDRLGARLIETHISWVLVIATHAYKIKKPLDLGFLDFSTAERRRFCCAEEIRLNRRLAPHIYLDVVAVTGPEDSPSIGGEGPLLDWAVRMRAFPADATLDREKELTAAQIDAIADRVAGFHGEIERAPDDSPFGTHEAVMYPVRENFRQIRGLAAPVEAQTTLDRLEAWSEAEGERLADHFGRRKAEGQVRECHGDLHLGNIAWVDDAPLIFDCIEFNPALRFIDVASEVAFLFMDLVSRDRDDLAWRFLNRWLELTGDYAGLDALRFYAVYRAMVRAKVNFIRAGQDDAPAQAEALRYLALAERLSRPGRPALLLMHGLSGSGKTWLSQRVLEALGAVRLRSDVERKRLFGLAPLAESTAIPGGIYTEDAGRRTFERLAELARQLLEDGYAVIVDATFLRQPHRAPLLRVADKLGVPCRILSLKVDESVLRQRVSRRAEARDDASEATPDVLASQLASQEPFTAIELPSVRVFDGADSAAWEQGIAALGADLGSQPRSSAVPMP